MAWYEVRGGRPLDGAVKIQGSKNGALPVLAGALLHRGRTVLHNCPGITDVGYTLEILRSLGCSVTVEKDALILDAAGLDRNLVPESLGEKEGLEKPVFPIPEAAPSENVPSTFI